MYLALITFLPDEVSCFSLDDNSKIMSSRYSAATGTATADDDVPLIKLLEIYIT
jgi:hypothetical protein